MIVVWWELHPGAEEESMQSGKERAFKKRSGGKMFCDRLCRDLLLQNLP